MQHVRDEDNKLTALILDDEELEIITAALVTGGCIEAAVRNVQEKLLDINKQVHGSYRNLLDWEYQCHGKIVAPSLVKKA